MKKLCAVLVLLVMLVAAVAFAEGDVALNLTQVHDYEVAKSIDAKCILVTTGHQNRKTLESVNVPIMDSLMESLDFIYERD